MKNSQIATIFEEISQLLELDGVNFFRVNAYRKASETVQGLGRELADIYAEDPQSLQNLTGIGSDLASKIEEMLSSDQCKYHSELVAKFGRGILDIMKIRSVGPKKAKLFLEKLGIDNLEKLRKAASAGKLKELPRMGEKSEQEILEALQEHEKYQQRMHIDTANNLATDIIAYMKPLKHIDQIEYAGSLRRGKETIGDLDILVSPKKISEGPAIIQHFQKYPQVSNIIADGPTKTSVILENGVQVDVRIIEPNSYGAALHYFTGSKEHNIAIRDIAKKHNLKVNEYGVFKDEKQIAGKSESEIYELFKLPYISPRLRENNGEFEAARQNKLPKLVEFSDLQGDLHMHSNWSDGKNSIEEIANTYVEAGFKYIAITDHGKSLHLANGLDEKRFREQWEEIDQLNQKFKGKLQILKGIECDIHSDGTLDFPDSFLKQFDLVIASHHTSVYGSTSQDRTEQLIKALRNPYVKILGHPTGREINHRPPYNVNIEKIIQAAKEFGKCLEINSQPKRLDLKDSHARLAKKHGVKICINSDSHRTTQIQNLQYGIWTAQRGWLEATDVVNTQSMGLFYFNATIQSHK